MYRQEQPEFLFTPDAFRAAQQQGAYELTYDISQIQGITDAVSQAGLGRLQRPPSEMTFLFTNPQDYHEQSYRESRPNRLFIPAGQLHDAEYAPEVTKEQLESFRRPVLELPTATYTGVLGPVLARAIIGIQPPNVHEPIRGRIVKNWRFGKRSTIQEILHRSAVTYADAIKVSEQ